MLATLWSWCEEISYWNSPIISSKYAYSIEIRTSIYPSGVSCDRDLDGEKEKRMNSQKIVVLMLWRSLFEVSDSLFIIVIIVSQIDLKICLVLTCWLTAFIGAVFQVTKKVCWGKDVYHIQSIKNIDSNRLEIGTCFKYTKIDVKLPYLGSRLLFLSFLLLLIITPAITTKQLPRQSNETMP